VANPQLTLAVLQALIVHGIVDPNSISRLQDVVEDKPLNAPPPPPMPWQTAPPPYYPPLAVAAPPPSTGPESALLDPQQQVSIFGDI
jgi:Hinge domain of cleavage stimulation factor subunit 2